MKLIRDVFKEKRGQKRPVVSFEFFPPKTPEGDVALLEKTIPALAKLKPDFCSVTYGAGGSTRDKTLMITDRIQREQKLIALHHLTCVNATREEIGRTLDAAAKLDIRNILALRGDPPGGEGEFKKTEGGFEFSKELVAFIRERGGFSIGAAGFPEGHIACKEGKIVDWDRLKQKIDAGVDFVVTQLFFDNADYIEFHNYLTGKLRVTVPICPGIMPILSAKQMKRITQLCGARWPSDLLAKLDALGDDDDAVTKLGIEHASRQCEDLIKLGVPGIHFYTMNKVAPARAIMTNIGLA
jgi:methylenetetrahydrofolate reductase (NADPH)